MRSRVFAHHDLKKYTKRGRKAYGDYTHRRDQRFPKEIKPITKPIPGNSGKE
jgi:hypothetical protein